MPQPNMSVPRAPKSVFFGVYAIESASRATLVRLVDETWNGLLVPTIAPIANQYKVFEGHLVGTRYRSSTTTTKRPPEFKRLGKEDLFDFAVNALVKATAAQRVWFPANVAFAIANPQLHRPNDPMLLEADVRADRVFDSGRVPLDFQTKLVECAITAFESSRSIVGYITYDIVRAVAAHGESPYENWSCQGFDRRELASRARGYYWGNLLSHRHIALVGGIEAFFGKGFYTIRPVTGGYYIQLTDDINNIDRKLLWSLRDLLAPVLQPPIAVGTPSLIHDQYIM